jgi:predicted TIM-barrel fold metal-dependent hydrolase
MAAELLISADSHVNVHHRDVKNHLNPKFHDGYDAGVAELRQLISGGNAEDQQARRDKAKKNAAFGGPGHFEPEARIKDMDLDGVQAEVMYCEVSAYRYLYKIKDGWRESTRAFNDTLADFASYNPERLVVSYQVPIHDIDFAVEEVRRIAGLGGKSLQLPVFPLELGFPDYYDTRYDPLWAVVQELDMPICCHAGVNMSLDGLLHRDPTPGKAVWSVGLVLSIGEAIAMWMCGGVLERFPGLKVVFVEPGLSWMTWVLWALDDMAGRQGYSFPDLREKPSFYYHRNIYLTFQDEMFAVEKLRHELGVTNILWSTDYPHPVTSWPNSRETVETLFRNIPADERALIVHGNAERVWNL